MGQFCCLSSHDLQGKPSFSNLSWAPTHTAAGNWTRFSMTFMIISSYRNDMCAGCECSTIGSWV